MSNASDSLLTESRVDYALENGSSKNGADEGEIIRKCLSMLESEQKSDVLHGIGTISAISSVSPCALPFEILDILIGLLKSSDDEVSNAAEQAIHCILLHPGGMEDHILHSDLFAYVLTDPLSHISAPFLMALPEIRDALLKNNFLDAFTPLLYAPQNRIRELAAVIGAVVFFPFSLSEYEAIVCDLFSRLINLLSSAREEIACEILNSLVLFVNSSKRFIDYAISSNYIESMINFSPATSEAHSKVIQFILICAENSPEVASNLVSSGFIGCISDALSSDAGNLIDNCYKLLMIAVEDRSDLSNNLESQGILEKAVQCLGLSQSLKTKKSAFCFLCASISSLSQDLLGLILKRGDLMVFFEVISVCSNGCEKKALVALLRCEEILRAILPEHTLLTEDIKSWIEECAASESREISELAWSAKVQFHICAFDG